MHELARTGILRFGVVFAPKPSTFFVEKDANGMPRGVAVDLARYLARTIGRAVEFTVAPNTADFATFRTPPGNPFKDLLAVKRMRR